MTPFDSHEQALLDALDAGQLTSVATAVEVQALRAAAQATLARSRREAARVCCEEWDAVLDRAGGSSFADEHSPL